jgi:hypothetical protein
VRAALDVAQNLRHPPVGNCLGFRPPSLLLLLGSCALVNAFFCHVSQVLAHSLDSGTERSLTRKRVVLFMS